MKRSRQFINTRFRKGAWYWVATWGGRAKYRCVDIGWNRKSASFMPARRGGKEFRVRIAFTDRVENCLCDSMIYGRIWADQHWSKR
jgi:hypothetical protein